MCDICSSSSSSSNKTLKSIPAELKEYRFGWVQEKAMNEHCMCVFVCVCINVLYTLIHFSLFISLLRARECHSTYTNHSQYIYLFVCAFCCWCTKNSVLNFSFISFFISFFVIFIIFRFRFAFFIKYKIILLFYCVVAAIQRIRKYAL